MKNTRPALVFLTLMYAYLFFFTLNFNYVEGDDAATILYHLCGRDSSIQKPYAAYNSGLDFVLESSGLHSEASLRILAVTLSFISGWLSLCLLVLLLERLAIRLVPDLPNRSIFYVLLPFMMPDVIFLSLIINASNISFVLLLASLYLFVKYLETSRNINLILAMIAFALCLPFRWTMATALPLFVGLYGLYNPFWKDLKNHAKPLLKIIFATLSALLLGIVLIAASGYNWNAILATISSTTGYLDQSEVSAMAWFASSTAFFTPIVLLLLFLGLYRVIRWFKTESDKALGVLFFTACSVSPFVLLGFFPMYKYLMSLLPLLFLLMLVGISIVTQNKSAYASIAIIVVSLLPWLVGIQIQASGTFCGPGFELSAQNPTTAMVAGRNPDNRIKVLSAKPVLSGGFYLPSPEGPRSFYGYAYVLLGGGWKKQVDLFTEERIRMFNYLTQQESALYFQDRMSSYFSCDLYRYGFHTKTKYLPGAFGMERLFVRSSDSLRIRIVPADQKAQWMREFFDKSTIPVVFRSTYSNDLLKLQSEQIEGVTILGPFTALKQ